MVKHLNEIKLNIFVIVFVSSKTPFFNSLWWARASHCVQAEFNEFTTQIVDWSNFAFNSNNQDKIPQTKQTRKVARGEKTDPLTLCDNVVVNVY